jgi:YVTN family beta-propeller protein
MTAYPGSGYSVGSWSGTNNNSSTSTTNTVTMPSSPHTVTANYITSPISYLIYVPLLINEDSLNDPPGNFGKISPQSGDTGLSISPTLSWSSSIGVTEYFYCIDMTNDNACSGWTSTGLDTSVMLTGLNFDTPYFWHVKATNTAGTTYSNGNSSAAFWSFTTRASAGPEVIETVSVYSGPTEVVFSPDDEFAYIAHLYSPYVSIIRVSDHTMIDSINVPSASEGYMLQSLDITPDGNFLFVSNRGLDTIVPIRLSDKFQYPSISVGDQPMGIDISHDGTRAYVSTFEGIDVIDILTRTKIDHIDIGGTNITYGNIVSPDDSLLYVNGSNDSMLLIIDTTTLEIVDEISLPGSPSHDLDITSDGNWLWTTNSMSYSVSRIDLSTNNVTTSEILGKGTVGVALSMDGLYVYITAWGTNSLYVLRTSDLSVVSTITTGDHPVSIEITHNGRFLYIPNEFSGTISVVDTGY